MTNARGKKAQGQKALAKLCCIRHGHASRRSCNAEEKTAETAVRQADRRVILEDWE